ncbi:hypothetical protein [Vibrio sp. TBV020]|uniref:hypothetical protein n=1 Tax=Vibrio sp. TBV020 TaxID=3137398 RepID=UPI0038CD7145
MVITYPTLKEESIQRLKYPDRMIVMVNGVYEGIEFNETTVFLCDDGRILNEHQQSFEEKVEQALNIILDDELSDEFD